MLFEVMKATSIYWYKNVQVVDDAAEPDDRDHAVVGVAEGVAVIEEVDA